LLAVVTITFVLAVPPVLAAVTIAEFGTPTAHSGPQGIALGADGNIWFTEEYGDNIGKMSPSSPPVFDDEYPVTGRPWNITAGPDGNMWFTTVYPATIGRITPSGVVTQFPVPTPEGGFHSWPQGITTGPDGNLWFTLPNANMNGQDYLGRITTSGVVTEFPLDTDNDDPQDIVAGPDGNLWFTELGAGQIGQITTSGVITEFPITGISSTGPGITVGPDGALWFAEGGEIGRMNTTGTGGSIPLPTDSYSWGVGPGSCSNSIWYTSGENGARVGQVTTLGVVTQYTVPTANSYPWGITPGTRGTDWFTEYQGSQIGRAVDTLGAIACIPYLPGEVFATPVVKDSRGGTVGWLMQDPGTHGVADTSGLMLYGYDTATGGPAAIPVGSFTTFTFDWAGTFRYDDPFNPASAGEVKVPVKVKAVVGAVGEAQVTWASGDAPAGDVFDVQLKAPGSTKFVTWQDGVTDLSAVFGSSDPLWAGPGKYSFRARLRKLSSGAASGYSSAVSISLA
jgi:streptogramin lyase